MNNSPRARLGHAAFSLRWLFEPAGELSKSDRSFLLAQLFGSPLAAIMGSFCALAVVGTALVRTANAVFFLFAALELTLMVCRLVEWRSRYRRSSAEPDHVATIDVSVLLSFLWCTLQGFLAFTIMSADDLVLSVLSATLVMATAGPICARNYAAPRFAFLLVLLCDLPFVAGALASREPWLAVILPITPPFLFGAMQIIRTFHGSMLLTLAAQAKTLYLAEHDSLTGILNRQGMDQALSEILPNEHRQMALISIDLDGFKQVNDRYGHGAGDILLIQIAGRLTDELRDNALLARMGGDEFMAVVRDMAPEEIGPFADLLIAAISCQSYDLGQSKIARVGASIGFACLPEDAASTVELRLRADEALYAAKGAGKGIGRRYGAASSTGLVTVSCRSPISLCHLGFERERADAAQI
jgi:diguanylate cyclase (GGDEF)-like protein